MKKADIIKWMKTEFAPLTLATPDQTLKQVVDNAVRYFNTHSGFRMVSMLDLTTLHVDNELLGTGDGVTSAFVYTVVTPPPAPSSVVITTSSGAFDITITDDGHGVLVSPQAVGTVDYLTGTINLLFNSGFAPNVGSPIIVGYGFAGGTGKRIPVDPQYKMISKCYPAVDTTYIWSDYSLWTLLGKTVIDNTMDMIALSTAYKNYQIYVGADFRWTFEKPANPTQNGYLYLQNMPTGTTRLCLIGAKRILDNEDIQSEHIIDWMLKYCKALVKMIEGNTLRKADIINVRNDGDRLVQEGKEEAKELEARLANEGRWLALARRF